MFIKVHYGGTSMLTKKREYCSTRIKIRPKTKKKLQEITNTRGWDSDSTTVEKLIELYTWHMSINRGEINDRNIVSDVQIK